jgi:site-specific DNA-methyltransferase (adenine-specific)
LTCDRKIGPYDCCSVVQGDCLELMKSLPDGCVDAVITDPPYGQTSLRWDQWVCSWPRFTFCDALWCFGSLRMFMDHVEEFAAAGWKLSQDIVWEKQNGSSFHNDRFRRVHEQVCHFYRGEWRNTVHNTPTTPDATAKTVRRQERPPHMGQIENSTYVSHFGGPRLMRSVLFFPNCHGDAEHPTQKPVELIEPLISYAVPDSGLCVDPFCGSGTTLVAAKKLGRHFLGFEISPEYCEISRDRLARIDAQPNLFQAPPEQLSL